MSPDGRWLFTGTWKGDPARVWDVKSGEVIRRFPGMHVAGNFSRDGERLVVCEIDAFTVLRVSDWSVERRIPRTGEDGLAGRIGMQPAGPLAALAVSRFAVQLVDITSGELLVNLPNPSYRAVRDLAFSPDGQTLATALSGGFVYVWDIREIRRELASLGLDWDDPSKRRAPHMDAGALTERRIQ
jgi:WD40 repeat protein